MSIAVGAGLKLGDIFQNKVAIVLSSTIKLLGLPLIIWGVCAFLEINTDTAKMAILFGAMPTATSAYILAKKMGGDANAMAQIITFQTLMAALTLPFFLAVVQSAV